MKTYDLLVIGAGNLGTFHAYHALQMGKKVLMLEKDSQPSEATVRNFGQVVPSGQALDDWFEYGRASLDIYKKIQAQSDITLRQNGTYYIASDEDEMNLLEEAAFLFREKEYPSKLLSKNECRAKIPSLRESYVGNGLFLAEECSVEPQKMVHRVRQLLVQDMGLDYRPNTTAVGCEVKNGLCEVQTANNERFWSERVVICNGRDLHLLFPEVFRASGMKVVKLNMMSTVPMPEVQLPGNILSGLSIRRYDSFKSCPSYPTITQPDWLKPYQHWGIHILFKQALDGSIIIGDSHEYADVSDAASLSFSISMELNALILSEARRMMSLPKWDIAHYWAGYYAQTPDGGAFTHQIDGRIYISTGIGGKGMTTSPGFAAQRIQEIFG
jgi:FAD dependent oxidoreductase TIGR03364